MDTEVNKFIKLNPECTVVNLGCGLDNRFKRVDNGKIEWYNVEFETVMEIRKQVIAKHERVHNIEGSVLDYKWMEQIKNRDNVLIIAEGLLMYLHEHDVKQLFHFIAEKFQNVTLVCELMSQWMVDKQKMHPTIQETGAVFCFGIKNTEDFVKICPDYKMLGVFQKIG